MKVKWLALILIVNATIALAADLSVNIVPNDGIEPVNYSIAPGLVDNAPQFNSQFFKSFQLSTRPLKLNDAISKNYKFPALYGKSVAAIALFDCSYDSAVKLVGDPRLKPVDMGNGRSVVVISSYRYNEILGMEPYNEVGILIPVMLPNPPVILPFVGVVDPNDIPLIPMLLNQNWPGLGYHMVSMPVTAYENQIRGVKIWRLPKVVQEIDHFTDRGDYVTIIKDETGAPYLSTRVPMSGKVQSMRATARIFSNDGKNLIKFDSISEGLFAVNQFPKIENRLGSDIPYIQIFGHSKSAQILRDLDISEQPFQLRFGNDISAALTLPTANPLP